MKSTIVSIVILAAVPTSPISSSLRSPTGPERPNEPAVIEPVRPATAPSAGQWTYQSLRGWQWMPYDFARSPRLPDPSLANMLMLYPAFGWRWVAGPWVLGYFPLAAWDTPEPPRHFDW
jgi:hypothetical protein